MMRSKKYVGKLNLLFGMVCNQAVPTIGDICSVLETGFFEKLIDAISNTASIRCTLTTL